MKDSKFDAIAALLADLRHRRISIWSDGDKLQIWQYKPTKRLTQTELDYLRTHKAEVLAYLSRRNEDLLPDNEACEAWRKRYCNTHQTESEQP